MVCSGSLHLHVALSTRPHFFIDVLKRPIPVGRRFSVVHMAPRPEAPQVVTLALTSSRCCLKDMESRSAPVPLEHKIKNVLVH
jgi:hypothetical protein